MLGVTETSPTDEGPMMTFTARTEHGVTPPAAVATVALLTTVCLELIRTTGPLLQPAFDAGVPTAAGTAVLAYAAAGLFGLVLARTTRSADGATATLTAVIVLAAARVVVQGLRDTPRVWVGLATIGLAIAVLTLATSGP